MIENGTIIKRYSDNAYQEQIFNTVIDWKDYSDKRLLQWYKLINK